MIPRDSFSPSVGRLQVLAALKELLLPLIELGKQQLALVAQVGNGHAVHEMPFGDPRPLLRRKMPTLTPW